MNKKGQMNVGEIVVIIMMIFVGLALIQEIFNIQATLTTKTTITDESLTCSTQNACWVGTLRNGTYLYTITNYPTDWQLDDCPITSFVITNSSGSTTSAWVENTDYTFNAKNGTYYILNTAKTNITTQRNNITLVDYTYCQDGYNKDSGSRGIAGIIGLFTAMALLGGILYYIKVKESFD